MLKAVVDTNVWVSGLLNPHGLPAEVVDAWCRGRFAAVVPAMVLEEIRDVLGRLRIRRRFRLTDEEVAEFVRSVGEGVSVIATSGLELGCRDPKDDALLEAATISSADAIVTRDDDLKRDADLVEKMQRAGTTVMSVSAFLRLLQ